MNFWRSAALKTANYFYTCQGNTLITYCLIESDMNGRHFGAGIRSADGNSKTCIYCLGLTDSMTKAVEFLEAADKNCVLPENFSEVAADWFAD